MKFHRKHSTECSTCRGQRDRPGQSLCKKCHAAYMREWRSKRVYVLKEDA